MGIGLLLQATQVTQVHAGEVTLYGGVDISVGYVHTSYNGSTANDVSMYSSVLNDSMIGFRGSEMLSDGWSVSFDLASEINAYDGTLSYDSYFGLQSTLGLKHQDWGSLDFGRQQTISTNIVGNFDPMQISFGQASMSTSFTAINTQIYDNMIQYTSPTWSGFQFGLGYSFNTGDTALYADSDGGSVVPSSTGFGTNNKMRALSAAMQYNSGPLLLVASYDRAFASSTIPDGSSTTATLINPEQASPQAWYFGAAYTLDKVVLSAAWGRGINGVFSGSGPISSSPLPVLTGEADMLFSQGFNQNSYLLGMSWTIDDDTQFMASWQMLKPTGQLASTPGFAAQQVVGAALVYSLSKRTAVYAWASYSNNLEMASGAKATVIGTGIQTAF